MNRKFYYKYKHRVTLKEGQPLFLCVPEGRITVHGVWWGHSDGETAMATETDEAAVPRVNAVGGGNPTPGALGEGGAVTAAAAAATAGGAIAPVGFDITSKEEREKQLERMKRFGATDLELPSWADEAMQVRFSLSPSLSFSVSLSVCVCVCVCLLCPCLISLFVVPLPFHRIASHFNAMQRNATQRNVQRNATQHNT